MRHRADWLVFLREFRQTFRTTGSIVPSSRFLARAITKYVVRVVRPARFLEAGPGVGPFTDRLIDLLEPGDSLVLSEINPRFVEVLEARLDRDPRWRAKREQVRIIAGPIEELPAEEKFASIVCGIPFSNFEADLVDRLLTQLLGHLAPGATFSFFEYFALRKLKAPFVGRSERIRLREVGTMFHKYLAEYEIEARHVALNFPPAVVHHLQAKPSK